MNTNPIPGVNFEEIGLSPPTQKNDSEDTKSTDFLQLFVTQMRNQNPLEPEKGADFLAQLAQFSTVEGIKNMEDSLSNVANAMSSSQALQATSLVGKKVEVLTDQFNHAPGNVTKGSFELPSSASNVNLEIKNAAGEVVRSYQFNTQSKGEVPFVWDGLDSNGAPVAPGTYQVKATADIQGTQTALDTFIASNVESVSINKNGEPLVIHVEGFGQVSLNDVKKIS